MQFMHGSKPKAALLHHKANPQQSEKKSGQEALVKRADSAFLKRLDYSKPFDYTVSTPPPNMWFNNSV